MRRRASPATVWHLTANWPVHRSHCSPLVGKEYWFIVEKVVKFDNSGKGPVFHSARP